MIRVTATKGSSATNSIGVGTGTCGTVTIGGSEYYNGTAYENDGGTYLATSPLVYPPVPSGSINGLFSVSSTKMVYFSQGNLQATTTDLGANWSWAFAAHQYDYIGGGYYNSDPKTGNNNINGNGTLSENGTVDLFGWSTSATYYGINISNYNNSTYSGDFVDWGSNIGSGWRTLTKDEWVYLFNTRTNAASKFGYATVGGTHGIIILPDDFSDPMKNNGSGAFAGSSTTGWDANVYTEGTNWDAMEDAGAVFLPAAGAREKDNKIWYTENSGTYWSSTSYNAEYVWFVFITESIVDLNTQSRCNGLPVRLVYDAN